MNRYAETTIGPVRIVNGQRLSTAQCRRLLSQSGVQVTAWARNWMAFYGCAVTDVEA